MARLLYRATTLKMKRIAIALALGAICAGGMALGAWVRPSVNAPAGAAVTDQSNAASGPALFVVASAASTPQATARTVKWDDLVPKDWDPLKKFRGMNLDALSDADPRAIELLQRMRDTWDNAPSNNAMDEQRVRIAGYVVPLDENKSGLTRFLLVPYFGACIHTPPPPSNQIIDVTPRDAAKFRVMSPVWITGVIRTLHSDTTLGASSYRMSAEQVEWYTPGLDKGLGVPR